LADAQRWIAAPRGNLGAGFAARHRHPYAGGEQHYAACLETPTASKSSSSAHDNQSENKPETPTNAERFFGKIVGKTKINFR
jgi:hypothetical protein